MVVERAVVLFEKKGKRISRNIHILLTSPIRGSSYFRMIRDRIRQNYDIAK